MVEGIGKLNLGELEDGEVEVGNGEMMATPRCGDDVVPTTPRGGQKEMKEVFKLSPEQLGPGKVFFAWQPNGGLLAAVGTNSMLSIFDMEKGSEKVKDINLQSNDKTGKVNWIGWDSAGEIVAVLQPGIAMYAWNYNTRNQLVVIDQSSDFRQISFCKWAKGVKKLALGSANGKVMLFDANLGQVLPQKDGDHNKAIINCGDWTTDDRLILGSKNRVKVSEVFATENSEWKTCSKIRTSKLQDKVPKKMVSDNGAYDSSPDMICSSYGTQLPMAAMNLGSKVMVVLDWEGGKNTFSQKVNDEGFYIPMAYGEITTFLWLANGLLVVALSNGYVLAVDTDLLMMQDKEAKNQLIRGGREVMKAGRVFAEYLTDVCPSPERDRILACGDCCTKIIECNRGTSGIEIVITHEVPVKREFSLGNHLDKVQWAPGRLCVSATDGYVYVYSI